jgi:hypothetical protein
VDSTLQTLCVYPGDAAAGTAWMGKEYGGFAKLLERELASSAIGDGSCDSVCIVSYGRARDAWLTITIAAAPGNPAPIDLLSYELLTDEERRRLALSFDDTGRVV